jgi:hypothetical protein
MVARWHTLRYEMLWELLHIDRHWLCNYALRLQDFHKTVFSASSYMRGMHWRGTQLTLLLVLQFWFVAAVARLLFDGHVAVSEPLAWWGGPATRCREDRRAWRTGNDVALPGTVCRVWQTPQYLRIGSVPGQIRTKNFPIALQKNYCWNT